MEEMERILRESKTIAMVGLSANPARDSHHVAEYLMQVGYRVIPVNPTVDQVLGEKAYPSLRDVPVPIDLVDIFRRPEDVLPIVEEAIAVGAKAIWMQLGVINEEAAERARQAGLPVVMNHCTLVEHKRLIGK